MGTSKIKEIPPVGRCHCEIEEPEGCEKHESH